MNILLKFIPLEVIIQFILSRAIMFAESVWKEAKAEVLAAEETGLNGAEKFKVAVGHMKDKYSHILKDGWFMAVVQLAWFVLTSQGKLK